MSRTSAFIILILTALALASLLSGAHMQTSENVVVYTDVTGYISVSTVEHVKSTIVYSESVDAKAIVLRIDTLGGSADSMLQIVKAILSSDIPIIGYVYPQASRALSAGTYILMAADYAVMSPYSTIGSAQPVVGSEPTNEPKYVNAFKAEMVSYVSLHGRNSSVAEKFVTENLNLHAQEAKDLQVIDAVEQNIESLLENANGKSVKRGEQTFTLNTYPFRLVYFEKPVNVQILDYVTDPLLSSLLLSMGFMAVLVGLSTPGIGAEVAGTIMILLGLIGFGINVNLISGILIIFGMLLFVVELKKGTHGVAAIFGTFTLTLGFALTISNPFSPTLVQPEWILRTLVTVVAATLAGGLILTFIIVRAIAVVLRKKPFEWLPTGEGKTLDEIGPDRIGFILINGEYWQATSDEKIDKDCAVIVTDRCGRVLKVKKKV
ncbi:MAG: NfeD family protein [Nitrososphaeria archaeon]